MNIFLQMELLGKLTGASVFCQESALFLGSSQQPPVFTDTSGVTAAMLDSLDLWSRPQGTAWLIVLE